MRRDYVIAAIIWVALSVAGELLFPLVTLVPGAASEQGILIDGAFRQLVAYSIPVFAFVFTGLIYSMLRFRSRGEGGEDGPHMTGSNRVYALWLVVTIALGATILVNPGITGVLEMRKDRSEDIIVQVYAEQWNWTYTYPEYGIMLEDPDEIAFPIDMLVKFEVTSEDVIHSFWIPSFRMKVDAVPGMTTVMYVRPSGTSEDEFNMRVQCAELCGTGHSRMRTASVLVLELAEFEEWIDAQAQSSGTALAEH